jgi:hypothetical protein
MIRLLDSRSSNCKAIIGPSTCENALFCGEPTIIKPDLTQSSYCAEHHARFYQPRGSVSDYKRWERRIMIAPPSHDGRTRA